MSTTRASSLSGISELNTSNSTPLNWNRRARKHHSQSRQQELLSLCSRFRSPPLPLLLLAFPAMATSVVPILPLNGHASPDPNVVTVSILSPSLNAEQQPPITTTVTRTIPMPIPPSFVVEVSRIHPEPSCTFSPKPAMEHKLTREIKVYHKHNSGTLARPSLPRLGYIHNGPFSRPSLPISIPWCVLR
jgi:hypothetical protein